MTDELCPDCGRPLSTHEMYRENRCPVVRLGPPPAVDHEHPTDAIHRLKTARVVHIGKHRYIEIDAHDRDVIVTYIEAHETALALALRDLGEATTRSDDPEGFEWGPGFSQWAVEDPDQTDAMDRGLGEIDGGGE